MMTPRQFAGATCFAVTNAIAILLIEAMFVDGYNLSHDHFGGGNWPGWFLGGLAYEMLFTYGPISLIAAVGSAAIGAALYFRK